MRAREGSRGLAGDRVPIMLLEPLTRVMSAIHRGMRELHDYRESRGPWFGPAQRGDISLDDGLWQVPRGDHLWMRIFPSFLISTLKRYFRTFFWLVK